MTRLVFLLLVGSLAACSGVGATCDADTDCPAELRCLRVAGSTSTAPIRQCTSTCEGVALGTSCSTPCSLCLPNDERVPTCKVYSELECRSPVVPL